MKNFLKIIGSATFMMAAMFNNQLVWNAAKYHAPEQVIVSQGSAKYSINKEYNEVLKDRHTDKDNGTYFIDSHKGNVRALNSFFRNLK